MFRIDYYSEGRRVGSVPHAGPLQAATLFARDGLDRLQCNYARIIDADGSGDQVESVTR